jgi:hypothetical protein
MDDRSGARSGEIGTGEGGVKNGCGAISALGVLSWVVIIGLGWILFA